MDFRRLFALATIAAFPLACTDKSPTQPVAMEANSASTLAATSEVRPSTRSVPSRDLGFNGMIGTWGGPHLNVTIGAASTILEYDCAHGSIDQPFAADQAGHFSLVGTHVPEAGGPVTPGGLVGHPARYIGFVDGKTMTFTVTETDTGQTLGPFTLTFGVVGRIFKCL